jgi:iron complex outermembrane receptor protein
VALAAGVQHRAEKWKADFDSQKNTGNIESGGSFQDSDVSQSARAAFVEIVAPLFDTARAGRLQFNGALRYENLGGVDTVDPKIGVLYTSPNRFMQLRGSWGTSFLAPNLFQRFTQSTGLANISDTGPGGTGEATRRITTITRGNPVLEPQESESYSLGVVVNPLPGLSLDLSYWNYDFRKLITLENVQALVDQNDPSKVIRDENGAVIFVVPSYVNLAGLQTSGLDFEVRHGFDLGRFGSLTSMLMATYVHELRVPVAGGGTVNVPDSRNSTVTGAPPSVDWRGLVRMQWELGPHSTGLSVRYTDSYSNDSTLVPPGVVIPPDNGTVDSFASVDVSYTYTFDEGFLGMSRSSVSAGALNVFESRVPRTADTVTLPFNDMRGRVAWLRFTANF